MAAEPISARRRRTPRLGSPGTEQFAANVLDSGRRTLGMHAAAMSAAIERLDDSFARAVRTMLECKGRVVVCGLGKSGLVGRKIAATLSSTGTPALVLHAAEAAHGDLGVIGVDDVVLFLSLSGETEEVVRLLPSVRSICSSVLALVGNLSSRLAKRVDIAIDASVTREACPHNLAPTTSAAVAMAIGDALAIALIEARGFRPVDFAQLHPGGARGRRLTTRVRDAMHASALPVCAPETRFADLVGIASRGGLGSVLVLDGPLLKGIITDGDLRRTVERGPVMTLTARDIMTTDPRTIGPDEFLVTADEIMREARITSLVVVEDGHLRGIIQIHD